MNIFETLAFIRTSNGPQGEYTKIAENIMHLYMLREISCQTVLRMYAEIVHIIMLDSSQYGQTVQGPRISQGL